MCVLLARFRLLCYFELFGTIIDAVAVVKDFLNYLFQNTVRPVDEHAAPQSHADSGRRNHFAATGALSGHRAKGCWGREIDARHLDDGLPRGFLSGAIVEVWVTLRLNWACELPLSRGEELP
jgi:hypothetical protein